MNFNEKLFSHNPKAIINFRKEAFQKLDSLPYPNLGKLKKEYFDLVDENVQPLFLKKVYEVPEQVKEIVSEDENVMVFEDGNIIFERLDERFDGIYINDFYSAYDEIPEIISSYLKKDGEKEKNRFQAYNTAFQNGGLVLRLPKKVEIDNLKIIYIQNSTDIVHRTLLILEERSKLNLIEYFVGSNKANSNIVTDIEQMPESELNYYKIDRLPIKSRIYSSVRAELQNNSVLNLTRGVLSKGNANIDIDVDLLKEGASTTINSIALASGDEVQNLNIVTNHKAKNTESEIHNQGVSKEKAKLVFNNTGKIENKMSQSKAFQSTRGIILSKDALLSANPFLLIDEYDVEAGHGASIGKFDDESLFYLMSRGLTKADAEKLIIAGFVTPIIEGISDIKLQSKIKSVIDDKLSERGGEFE